MFDTKATVRSNLSRLNSITVRSKPVPSMLPKGRDASNYAPPFSWLPLRCGHKYYADPLIRLVNPILAFQIIFRLSRSLNFSFPRFCPQRAQIPSRDASSPSSLRLSKPFRWCGRWHVRLQSRWPWGQEQPLRLPPYHHRPHPQIGRLGDRSD